MSVRTAISWSALGQATNFVVSFGGSVVLARLLTPREFGIYAIALATQGVLSIFTNFGVGAYMVRETELTRETIRRTYSVNALLSLVLAGAMLVAGIVSARLMGQVDVGRVLALLALTPILSVFEFVPATMLGRAMNFRAMTVVNVIRTTIAIGSTVLLASTGWGVLSLALGPVIASTYSAAAYTVVGRRDLMFRPTLRGLWPIILFGLQLMSISGVAQMATRLCDLILGRFLGLAALGLYARASSMSAMIWDNVYGLATRVIFSKLSLDLREKGSLHHVFVRSLSLITVVMWPLLIGLAVLSRPAIHILYGDKWLPAALPLSFLMIAQFIALGFGMNWELFVLRRETALQTRFEMTRAVFGVATFATGALFSIGAAAVGRIVEASFGYLLYRPHMDRMAGTEPGELERVYRESLLMTVAAVAPSLVLMFAEHWRPDTPPLLVAAAVALGIGSWFALIILRRHPLVDELRLLRRFLGERRRTPAPS